MESAKNMAKLRNVLLGMAFAAAAVTAVAQAAHVAPPSSVSTQAEEPNPTGGEWPPR
jgi:hypothetical protein